MAATALTRQPSRRLAEGLLTHVERTPIDLALADRQHASYCDALASSGWRIRPVDPIEQCPDSVFIEDAVVVVDDLAIITRPGAPSRRPETAGAEKAVRELGLAVTRIEEPGTLDGGDVLQIGSTVYVGRGSRTNAEGIRQLRALLAPRGRTVVPVALGQVLHLKSAATALPDGTVLALADLADTTVFPAVRAVVEEPGAHVVPLGGGDILIAASAPRTATMLADLGFTPVVVDISEFEKLEGCVTCLGVLLPSTPAG
jgi:dimethylargininase